MTDRRRDHGGSGPRIVALALIPILVGAAAVHVPHGWLFEARGGGWEYPAYLVVLSLAQALLGDGVLALRRSRPLPALGLSAVAR